MVHVLIGQSFAPILDSLLFQQYCDTPHMYLASWIGPIIDRLSERPGNWQSEMHAVVCEGVIAGLSQACVSNRTSDLHSCVNATLGATLPHSSTWYDSVPCSLLGSRFNLGRDYR